MDYFLHAAGFHSALASRSTRMMYLQTLAGIGLEEKKYEKAEKALEEILKLLSAEIAALRRSQGGSEPEASVKQLLKVKREKLIDNLLSILNIKVMCGSSTIWNTKTQKLIWEVNAYCSDFCFAPASPQELKKIEQVAFDN